VKATGLPHKDIAQVKATSDPLCELVALSTDGKQRFRQLTSVKVKTQEPVWNETFDIPVALKKDVLAEALEVLEKPDLAMLPPELFHNPDVDKNLTEADNDKSYVTWRAALTTAADKEDMPTHLTQVMPTVDPTWLHDDNIEAIGVSVPDSQWIPLNDGEDMLLDQPKQAGCNGNCQCVIA